MSPLDKFAGLSPDEIRSMLSEKLREAAELSVLLDQVQAAAPPISRASDRNIDECVLQAAPGPADPPISRAKLAPLAGYGYNRHFLAAVRKLIRDGLLTEIDGRVRRAS